MRSLKVVDGLRIRLRHVRIACVAPNTSMRGLLAVEAILTSHIELPSNNDVSLSNGDVLFFVIDDRELAVMMLSFLRKMKIFSRSHFGCYEKFESRRWSQDSATFRTQRTKTAQLVCIIPSDNLAVEKSKSSFFFSSLKLTRRILTFICFAIQNNPAIRIVYVLIFVVTHLLWLHKLRTITKRKEEKR
jgi:hypothetical protein